MGPTPCEGFPDDILSWAAAFARLAWDGRIRIEEQVEVLLGEFNQERDESRGSCRANGVFRPPKD